MKGLRPIHLIAGTTPEVNQKLRFLVLYKRNEELVKDVAIHTSDARILVIYRTSVTLLVDWCHVLFHDSNKWSTTLFECVISSSLYFNTTEQEYIILYGL